MKMLLLVAVVLVFGWFGWSRFRSAEKSVTPDSSAQSTVAVQPTPTPRPAPVVPPAPSPAPKAATAVAVSKAVVQVYEPTVGPAAKFYPQMVASEVFQPNNLFHDALFGVSVTYPDRWTVRAAQRWGDHNEQNTVFLTPPQPSHAIPSMYYQQYSNGTPAPADAEAFLRQAAQTKEDSRSSNGANDYKNVPDSFEFTQIDGHPALTYFAVFSQGSQVMTEHFIRILGQKGYVMFFTRGPLEDVKAIMPQLNQMAATVQVP